MLVSDVCPTRVVRRRRTERPIADQPRDRPSTCRRRHRPRRRAFAQPLDSERRGRGARDSVGLLSLVFRNDVACNRRTAVAVRRTPPQRHAVGRGNDPDAVDVPRDLGGDVAWLSGTRGLPSRRQRPSRRTAGARRTNRRTISTSSWAMACTTMVSTRMMSLNVRPSDDCRRRLSGRRNGKLLDMGQRTGRCRF